MTTLAIIGSGIGGRSLIYTLAKEKKDFKEIVVFESESFLKACSYRSTAVVARRGLTEGHSLLGDTLLRAYKYFERHVAQDRPYGIEKVPQVTGARHKLEEFKKRYPDGVLSQEFTKEELYCQKDGGYLIDPPTYLDFLKNEAVRFYGERLRFISDLVVEVSPEGNLRSHEGDEFSFDKIIFATGAYGRFWSPVKAKVSQGSFLEFSLSLDFPSLSLTLDSHNYIWNNKTKKLLLGSTTLEIPHELPPQKALSEIYHYFKEETTLPLPPFSEGEIRVGLREKAPKRSPYLFNEGKNIYMGGFYKNGYTLGLFYSNELVRKFF